MTVAEGQDGVGCLDVTHGDLPVGVVVAPTEGVDEGLLFPVIIVFGHGPVDWVVFQLEGSEEVHGGGGERIEVRSVLGGCWATTGGGVTRRGIYRESHRWSSGCSSWPGPGGQMVTHCYYSVTDAKSIQIESRTSASTTNGFLSAALQM